MRNVKSGHLRPVICLDAGHAGKYNQSPVCKEFYESQVVWKLQSLLKTELEAQGMEVRLTKNSLDADPGLVQRGKMAQDCDLFLSLHVNAAQRESADYVLAVYMVQDGCGIIDTQSKIVAQYLSDAVAESMGAKANVWSQESQSDRDGNGHPDDYYGVLRGAHAVGTAGVILEHGFYTNEKQANWLMQEKNLKALAKKESEVLADWFEVKEPGKSFMTTLRSVPAGTQGPRVKAIQALLIAKGYTCGDHGIDGSFGPATKKAVLAFQKANYLTEDAIVGAQTLRCLLGYME